MAERQGHPTGNFEKKTLKQQQSINKGFWSHLKHFGRLLEKLYLFLTPSKTNARVLSHQGSHTTCNLTYSEVSQQTYVQTLLTGLGVVLGKNSDLQWEGGGVDKRVSPKGEIHPFSRERGLGGREKINIIAAGAYHPDGSYSRHQIPFRHPDLSFSSYTFLPRTYYFLHISQPAEICRTDRLDAPGESCHVTYFGLLCYRNSSCQKYYYNVYEFLEN